MPEHTEKRVSGACSLYGGFFFFSSRRRHTRCSRGWSSDVCSSDLPVGGMRDPVLCPSVTSARCLGDLLWHLTLPALTLGLVGAAATARYQRAALVEVAGQDYVRTARAKGLRERRVLLVHALRNALLPFITPFGLAFPFLLTGAVLVERVFAWPGMGRLSVAAIFQRDYPLVTGA